MSAKGTVCDRCGAKRSPCADAPIWAELYVTREGESSMAFDLCPPCAQRIALVVEKHMAVGSKEIH